MTCMSVICLLLITGQILAAYLLVFSHSPPLHETIENQYIEIVLISADNKQLLQM
jgi:hypothetical protein